MSLVASAIANYHQPLYYAGGLLMLALALLSLSGKMLSLPSFLRAPDTRRGDAGSFFALGVFSGIASSCCAPVLAGVIVSPRSPVLPWAASPGSCLHLRNGVSALRDGARVGPVPARRAGGSCRPNPSGSGSSGRSWQPTPSTWPCAAAFATMGGFVIYLAGSAQMTGGPASRSPSATASNASSPASRRGPTPSPNPSSDFAVLALAAVFVIATLRDRRRHQPGDDDPRLEESDDHSGCHGASPAPASPRSATDLDPTDHQH